MESTRQCHRPPTGPAFGRPNDKLRRATGHKGRPEGRPYADNVFRADPGYFSP
jgi:hypothetical protein